MAKWGPTIAADAGEPRRSLANRSFSMNVISPGPASPTGRAERIETLPSPTNRPRTSSASCSTVATTSDFLSSLKGDDEDQHLAGRAWWVLRTGPFCQQFGCVPQSRIGEQPLRPSGMLILLVKRGKSTRSCSSPRQPRIPPAGDRGQLPISPGQRISPSSRRASSPMINHFLFSIVNPRPALQFPLNRDWTRAVRFGT